MAVASLLGQKSGKGKRKVREQEKSQETARTDFLQVRRGQPHQEVLCGSVETKRGDRGLTAVALLKERLS